LQGFGNVSQYAAIGFVEMLGGKVACVSCWDRHDKSYTYSHKDGCRSALPADPSPTSTARSTRKGRKGRLSRRWRRLDHQGCADVLIPAAIEGQVNAETVKKIHSRVKIVAEGANGPTTPEADEYFKANKYLQYPRLPVQRRRRDHLLL
jgi:glutamate dehydrogenase